MMTAHRGRFRSWLRAARCRLRGRDRADHDIREELRFHLESRAAHLMNEGMPSAEAARRARLEFGNPVAWQDQCRDARGLRLLEELAQDVRVAIRGFARQKALAAIVVATLTFGIGVSSGVFTLLDAVALRARVDDPASFVRVYAAATTDRALPGRPGEATVEEYAAFRERAGAASALRLPPLWRGDRSGRGPVQNAAGDVQFLRRLRPHARAGGTAAARRRLRRRRPLRRDEREPVADALQRRSRDRRVERDREPRAARDRRHRTAVERAGGQR
jgi:hypothetical protein